MVLGGPRRDGVAATRFGSLRRNRRQCHFAPAGLPQCVAVPAYAAAETITNSDPMVGGYILLSRQDSAGKLVGLDGLKALAENAATLPINTLYISFFSPTLVYFPGNNTLEAVGLGATSDGDYGFAAVKNYTQLLKAGGVRVVLSMGGWNYNCYPYFYARYSVAGYGEATPNYWKVQQYGGGSIDGCVESNQWCYTCEPPTEKTAYKDFGIFPEPSHAATWTAAKNYVESKVQGITVPVWNEDMIPGNVFTDPKNGIKTLVPGSNLFVTLERDPYEDFVYLAKDLDVDGIDLDYEEMWHADFFKTGSGPWQLPQTVFKYTAIAVDMMNSIKKISPKLTLSTAAGAVGGASGDWWGGNLKGVWYYLNQWFPEVSDFMSNGPNAGGINVMTYDLSSNEQYHECPESGLCALDKQVQYYMSTYHTAGIAANVGFEVSTPAYPDKGHDPSHQLPLTKDKLNSIISTTQSQFQGGFLWELFKSVDDPTHASPTEVAQAICGAVLKTTRCSGVIPGTSSSLNNCTPGSCNVCDACCKSYITKQTVCDGCVSTECKSPNVCSDDRSECTTCDACCKSYLSKDQSSCDACALTECPSIQVLLRRKEGRSSLIPQ